MGINDDMVIGINEDNSIVWKNGKHVELRYKHAVNIANIKIKLTSNGWCKHAFIYTFDNELYGFGSNNYAQIGCKKGKIYIKKPKLVKYSFDSMIKYISCGYGHSIFLTINGNVYGSGDNDFGQLTDKFVNNKKNINIEIQNIMNTNDVIKVGCGTHCSFILSNNNILNIFGYFKYKHRIIPNVIDFNCGGIHAGYITLKREIYMIGHNGYCQCGLLSDIDYCDYIPNELLTNKQINSVTCGYAHTIIKTNNNEYYSFGLNEDKQLLLNNNQRMSLPTLISLKYIQTNIIKSNKKIINLIAGCNETFILSSY